MKKLTLLGFIICLSLGLTMMFSNQGFAAKAEATTIKKAPTILLIAQTKTPTNQEIKISVAVTSESTIAVKKWGFGVKTAQQFSGRDTTFKGNAFTVTKNGHYTVYVLDKKGNKSTKTIKVTNIDQQKPTISLTQDLLDLTNQNVKISATIQDNEKVATKKWAAGSQNAKYFATAGETLTADSFNASQNGIYTVYAEDVAGNVQIQTISITNIDKSLPVIHLTIPAEDVTEVSKKIKVEVQDENGIKDQKWAYGEKSIAYFADKGSRIAPLQNANQKDKIIALKNGVYTIYVEDVLGNKAVQTIAIDGIKGYTEVAQEGVHCEVCRMDLFKTDPHKVYSAKAIDAEGYTHFFCRTGCMYHQQNANDNAFIERYVRDYGAVQPRLNNWIASEKAVTVKFKEQETAKGLMGWKLFHFANQADAANYIGVTQEQVVTESVENIIEYTKTNNKGMDFQYTVDKEK